MDEPTVTISLNDYNHLKRVEFTLDEVYDLAVECIKSAEVNKWDKQYLQLDKETTKRLLRYLNSSFYDKRLEEEQE